MSSYALSPSRRTYRHPEDTSPVSSSGAGCSVVSATQSASGCPMRQSFGTSLSGVKHMGDEHSTMYCGLDCRQLAQTGCPQDDAGVGRARGTWLARIRTRVARLTVDGACPAISVVAYVGLWEWRIADVTAAVVRATLHHFWRIGGVGSAESWSSFVSGAAMNSRY
jgi:hypothetical protein